MTIDCLFEDSNSTKSSLVNIPSVWKQKSQKLNSATTQTTPFACLDKESQSYSTINEQVSTFKISNNQKVQTMEFKTPENPKVDIHALSSLSRVESLVSSELLQNVRSNAFDGTHTSS